MSLETSTIQRVPLLSQFRTTVRNELHTWIAHSLIYAAYFVVVYFLVDSIDYRGQSFLKTLLFIVAGLPVAVQLITLNHWDMGFKSRIESFFVSIIVLLAYFLKNYEMTLQVFWLVIYLNLLSFLTRRLVARKRHSPDFLAVSLTLGIVVLIYFGLALYLRIIDFSLVSVIMKTLMMALVISAFAIVPLLQTITIAKRTKRLESLDRSHKFNVLLNGILIRSIFYFLAFIIIVAVKSLPFASATAFAIMLISAGPGLFFSRQKTHLANFLKLLGIKYITMSISTDPSPVGFLRIQLVYLKRFIDQNRQYVSILLILIAGGIFIPYLAFYYGLAKDNADLFYIGVTATFSLALMYLTLWFVKNRKKHIVFPFTVAEGQAEPQLQSLANLMTYAFIQQLRYLALLLSMKQVENIASRNDNTLPVFVTSSQEKELIEQVRSLGDVEVANTKISFGGLLAMAGTFMAHTKVRGTVVRQKDNSIAILVEFVQRGGQIVAVDMDFVPETSATDLDEKILNGIAKSLAVKLVIKLGNHAHLASSWVSLLNFVNGLDAAYHKNWWQAISYYRKSIHLEESSSGPTGSAYYHLAASLVSQGNIKEGYNYLKIAETKNAPQAEVQYMIALTQFYMFHDFLHIERAVFEDIKWRCLTALKNRPYFPEAHHLLGTVHYHRGKLLERSFTKSPQEAQGQYSRIEVLPQDYMGDYKNAVRELSKSIKGYDRTLRLLPRDIVAQGTTVDERAKLIQYRMSAAHRLGDALRSLERFSEGDMYYQETLYAYPVNIRTLVDRAKTFCFSGNWQKADEYIRYDIFNNEENRFNKSANFYMGWALAGGLIDKFSPSSLFSDFILNTYEAFSKSRRIDQLPNKPGRIVERITGLRHNIHEGLKNRSHENNLMLGKSMLYLDYAIHQYPRYIHRWKQTNWFDDFSQAAKGLGNSEELEKEGFQQLCYSSPLDGNKEYYVGQIYYWLCWRVALKLPIDDRQIDFSIRNQLGWKSIKNIQPHIPNKDFYRLFRCLVGCKERFEELLETGDKERVICNLKLQQSKLQLGKGMLKQWYVASELIQVKIDALAKQSTPKLTFADRWAVDIFAEFSMLTCHVLVESEAFEYAEMIGCQAGGILKTWINVWSSAVGSEFFFSSKVLDYQIASIQSWAAFSKYMKTQDYATKNRMFFSEDIYKEGNDMEEAQLIVDEAMKYMPHNPLAIFVNALILYKKGHKARAADELNKLLSQIAPFDPHVYSRRNTYIENYELSNRKMSKLQSENAHKYLIYGERSCGDLQFSNVMSVSQIHMQLAQIASDLEDYWTSIGHMALAFADTPYYDEQAEILLKTAEIYNKQGQYASALAVLEDANLRRKYLSPVGLPNARSLQVLVMECVLKTNMENYRDSLERGLEISDTWGNEDLSRGHDSMINYFVNRDSNDVQFINECLDYYKRNVLALYKDIESDTKYEGIVSNKRKLPKLIKALREHTILKILNYASIGRRADAPPEASLVRSVSFDFSVIAASQILMAMYKDVIVFIVQQCEWMNSCAFNYCELDLNIDEAEKYAVAAIKFMEELEEIGKSLEVVDWRARLAQFYDTLGWIYYRKGEIKDLQIAYDNLSNKALSYDQESATIYYHLARVRLAQIERIWQGIPLLVRKQVKLHDKNISLISQYLREAFLFWRHAHRLDRGKNLYLRLRIVRLRIDQYRKNWEKFMMPLGRGYEDDVVKA